jgi:hypothetical protein
VVSGSQGMEKKGDVGQWVQPFSCKMNKFWGPKYIAW